MSRWVARITGRHRLLRVLIRRARPRSSGLVPVQATPDIVCFRLLRTTVGRFGTQSGPSFEEIPRQRPEIRRYQVELGTASDSSPLVQADRLSRFLATARPERRREARAILSTGGRAVIGGHSIGGADRNGVIAFAQARPVPSDSHVAAGQWIAEARADPQNRVRSRAGVEPDRAA